jgi:hypothetical protein
MRIQYEKSLRSSNEGRALLPKLGTFSSSTTSPVGTSDQRPIEAVSRFPNLQNPDTIERTPDMDLGGRRKSIHGLTDKERRNLTTKLLQEERYHSNEVSIVEGALNLIHKTVTDVLVPMSEVFGVEADSVLDIDTIAQIYTSGHSRIPVVRTRARLKTSPILTSSGTSPRKSHIRKLSPDWIAKVFSGPPAPHPDGTTM